jgi:hypothetical protein
MHFGLVGYTYVYNLYGYMHTHTHTYIYYRRYAARFEGFDERLTMFKVVFLANSRPLFLLFPSLLRLGDGSLDH